ncbi:MAG: DKNYY domain-containing protein [Moheibacter sp.]
MKNSTALLIFTLIMNSIYAQKELIRIGDSSFFTNQKEIFYVVSNKFNNSGFLSKIKGVDTLCISNKEQDIFDKTAEIISKESYINHYIQRSEKGIYLAPITLAIKIPDIQLKGFAVIDNDVYAKYKEHIYFKFERIDKADSKTFEVLSSGTAKDKNYVYYLGNKIGKADTKTFEVIDTWYSKDKNYVFYDGKVLEKADPKSFQMIDYSYQKDKNHVWYIGTLTDIDSHTFKILEITYPKRPTEKYNSYYIVDSNHVYFQGKAIPWADLKSFRVVISGAPYQVYGIDNKNVYYLDKKLHLADAKTFNVITDKNTGMNYDAQDKNYFYKRDKYIEKR